MIPVLLGAAFVLSVLLGQVARLPEFKDGLLIRDFESKSGLQITFLMFQSALGAVFSPPALCFSGSGESDFTQQQCVEFWSRFKTHLSVLAVPLVILLGLVTLLWNTFRALYRGAQDQIALRKDCIGRAEVIRVGAKGFDLFEWFFCLTQVELRLQGEALRSYLPASEYLPRKGDQRLVYRWKKVRGLRFLSEPYAPHTAVVSGTRERG
jgi:hypothetical protein